MSELPKTQGHSSNTSACDKFTAKCGRLPERLTRSTSWLTREQKLRKRYYTGEGTVNPRFFRGINEFHIRTLIRKTSKIWHNISFKKHLIKM